MTESQRIVLNWKAQLKQMGWPEEAQRKIVSELCEAGYRACIEEIQARSDAKDRMIANVQSGVVN